MHGLGNDFVVLDGREQPLPLTPARIVAIGDRRRGVGFDQLVVLEPAPEGSDVFMRIANPDGSEAGACGNATRCVASLLMAETGRDRVTIRTISGALPAEALPDGLIQVDMGPARFGWRDVPLAREADTLRLPLSLGPVSGPAACSTASTARSRRRAIIRWSSAGKAARQNCQSKPSPATA